MGSTKRGFMELIPTLLLPIYYEDNTTTMLESRLYSLTYEIYTNFQTDF